MVPIYPTQEYVVSKRGTPVPIPLPVSSTISSSLLESERKISKRRPKRASKSQSRLLGIASSVSNRREGLSNQKPIIPANSIVKRPLFKPAASSSCNSQALLLKSDAAPTPTKPRSSNSQQTEVSCDVLAVHSQKKFTLLQSKWTKSPPVSIVQSKQKHSEHESAALEFDQFVPSKKPSTSKHGISNQQISELSTPEPSIARSKHKPTTIPSKVATNELKTQSFAPVLKSDVS